MSRFSYKTLILILLFLLIPIVLFLRISQRGKQVSAEWFNDSWNYRQRVDISNSSGSDLTDFQVSFDIGTSALIAAGKMQSDCDDIRITDQNGNLLPYWIEENNPGCNQVTDTKIWVKAPSLPTSGAPVYVYYGNSTASAVANGNDVFEFFDDFNSSSIDTSKWTVTGTMLSLASGRIRADIANGTGSMYIQSTFSRPFVLDMDFYPTQYPSGWEGSYHGSIAFGTFNTSNQNEHTWVPYGGGGNSYCGLCDDGGCYHGSYVNPLRVGDTLYNISMKIQPTIAGLQGVMSYTNMPNDGIGSSVSNTVYTAATTGDDPLKIGIKNYNSDPTDDFEWDNWRIRKYASSDPTTTPAPEEVGGGPFAYWSLDEGIGTTAYDFSQKYNVNISTATWQTEENCLSGKCLFVPLSTTLINSGFGSGYNPAANPLSISLWVKPNSTATNQIFLASDTGTDQRLYLALYAGYWDFGIQASSWSGTVGNKAPVQVNQWSHIYVTMDGSIAKLYVDGKFTIQKSYTSYTLSSNLYLNRGGGYPFFGHLDEIKFFPYARTETQIKADYASGLAGMSSSSDSSVNIGGASTGKSLSDGLVGYWKFDENSGNTTDYSGNNNNATVSGASNYTSGKYGNSFRAGIGATNRVTNPSFETSLTGWTDQTGGSMTQSNTTSLYGDYSVRTLGGRIYTTTSGTIGTTYTLSAWVKTDQTNKARIRYELNGGDYAWASGDSAYHPGDNVWRRLTITTPELTSNTTIYFFLYNNDGVNYSYFDGTQIEVYNSSGTSFDGYATPYFDGSTGYGNTWSGTAHNSVSYRTNSIGSVANSTSIDISGTQISLGAWVYLNKIPQSNAVVMQKSGYTAGYRIMIKNNGTIHVGIGETGGGYTAATSPLNLNTWNHVFSTYDGTNIRIYINGQLDKTQPYSNPLVTTTSSLYFGSTEYPPIDGYVDEARIYNRALNPTEVKQLYEFAPGPVAYWKFEEGVGTTAFDSSGNNNHGSWQGTLGSQWTIGKVGTAGNFNGSNNYVNFGDINEIDNASSLTVGLWLKPNNTGTSWGGYLSKVTAYPYNGFMLQRYGTENNRLYLRGWGNENSGVNIYITDNQWNYISFTWDGTTVTTYVNGQKKETWNPTNKILDASTSTLNAGQGTLGYRGGLIDEIKIYNYARNQKQILEDMNAGAPATSARGGPLIHYKFDEGNGTNSTNWGIGSNTYKLNFGAGDSAPSWSSNSKIGKSLRFDGTNYGDPSTYYLAQFSDHTYTAWFNLDTSEGGSTYEHPIFGSHQYSGVVDYIPSSKTFRHYRQFSTGGQTVSWPVSYQYADGKWHHLAMAIDQTTFTVKLYLDGKYIDTKSITAEGYTHSNGAFRHVGKNYGRFWTGYLDELKVYPYALTADEVKQDYNQGSTFVFGSSNQTIGATTTSLDYCIPGDTSPCSPPVAEWKFEEGIGTTAYDTSGNNCHVGFGTGSGAPLWDSNSKVGTGLNFTTEFQYLVGQTCSNQNFSTAFTAQAWVKKSSAGTSYDWIVNRGSSTYDFGFTIGSGSTTMLRVFKDNGSTYADSGTFPSIGDNKWHHIAVTFDNPSSYLNFFVDGRSVGVGNTQSFNFNSLTTNGSNYLIGAYPGPGHYFKGQMDHIRVYNYARTPAQIAYEYNKGAPVGHWKMDECQGTQIADWSGNANHGTLSIGASGTQTSAGTCTTSGTAWYNGKLGKLNASINLDGSDDIASIPNHANYQFSTKDFTISTWLKPFEDINNYDTVFSKSSSLNHNQYVNALFSAYGELRWYFDDSTETLWNHYVSFGANANFTNKWSHVLVTRQGTVIKGYLNGVLVSTSSVPDNYNLSNSYSIEIGKEGSIGTYFPGQIDDVRIYNYALTPTQIKTVYNNGSVNFR